MDIYNFKTFNNNPFRYEYNFKTFNNPNNFCLVLKGRTGEATRQKAKDQLVTKNSIDWKRPRKYNWQTKGLIVFCFLFYFLPALAINGRPTFYFYKKSSVIMLTGTKTILNFRFYSMQNSRIVGFWCNSSPYAASHMSSLNSTVLYNKNTHNIRTII